MARRKARSVDSHVPAWSHIGSRTQHYFRMGEPPSYPLFPYRHVRPSLLLEVYRWAVVSGDMVEYHRECSERNCDCDCDFTKKYQIVRRFLQHVRWGSQLEILGVFDGVDSEGLPLASPTAMTGMIWARHYFETGWIPVKYLLPMDIVVDDNVIAERILRASRVPMAVRLDALPFSPPIVPDGSRRNNIHPKDHELWETDSLGNFLFDIDEGPDADFLC